MTLWFVLALMTAAAMFAVLWPLARRARHRAQAAISRSIATSSRRSNATAPPASSGTARPRAAQVEVSRRLIAAADAQTATPTNAPSATWRRRAVAIAALVLLPLGAGTLSRARIAFASGSAARRAAVPGSVDRDLVAQVETHLEGNPDDGRGWEVIAPVYLRLGRFDDAVKARRNALRLNGETAERRGCFGEALVGAANGVVTAEAKPAFERAVALDAKDVKARYFLGLAAEQDGRTQAAASWRGMLAGAPADAPWPSSSARRARPARPRPPTRRTDPGGRVRARLPSSAPP